VTQKQGLAPIRFGTDGWRAIIAQEFTFANLERVTQAYAEYLKRQTASSAEANAQYESAPASSTEPTAASTSQSTNATALEVAPQDNAPLVVVGYDRRFLSEQFAERVAEILSGNELRVARFDEAVPTPLVSWAVREMKAAGGVVITASHNPPDFNGFKIKAPWGGSAAPETTSEVEALVDSTPPRRQPNAPTTAGDGRDDSNNGLDEIIKSYRQQIESYVDIERLRSAQESVVIDSMHGSGGDWIESFLRGYNIKAETIRGTRDPLFGGVSPEPIDRNLAPLKKRINEINSILGLATDGDADRVGAVNERGETMTMHEVVPLLLLHMARRRGMTGGVVRTVSQSVLTNRIAAAHNLKVYETPIGFKYIADLMLRENILIGAEESGGIGVQGHIPERDGILNALLLLEAVIVAGKTPSELVREMHREFGEFYFGRRDNHVEVERGKALVESLANEPPVRIAGNKVAGVETMDGTKLLFDDESWLLFRQSGTEPVLRIYSEATSIANMNALLDEGEWLASSAQ
jgi:phosphomannomutase